MIRPEVDLKLKGVYIAFLSAFSLPISQDICRDQAIQKLKNKRLNAEWKIPYSKNFKIAESFLLPEDISNEFFRIKLDDFIVKLMKTSDKGSMEIPISVSTLLTIYPKVSVGILLLNIKLEDFNVDDLIFLMQCLNGRFEVCNALSLFSHTGQQKENVSVKNVIEEYVKIISEALGSTVTKPRVLTAQCIEINSVDVSIENPGKVIERFPRQIYGILAADEGWRFVPPEIAKSRLSKQWRTRRFLTVVPFGNSVVVLNFHHGKVHEDYMESQKLLREQCQQQIEEYFTFSPEIAGLNHGPLLVLENALVQRVIMAHSSERMRERKPRRIKEFLRMRDDLADALAKLSRVGIPEVGILGQILQDTMQIGKLSDDLRKRLEEIERTLVIKYNQRINFWLIILALSSLGVGLLTIIMQIGLLD